MMPMSPPTDQMPMMAEGQMPMGQQPMAMPMMPVPPEKLWNVEVVKRTKEMRHRVMPIPPEEFGVARRARMVRDSHYCFHEPSGGRPVAELEKEGFDRDQLDKLPTYTSERRSMETMARDTVFESSGEADSSINNAMRPVRVTEHYIKMDYKGNGKTCLYRVTTGGDESVVLKRNGKPDVEEIDHMPFAAMTPFIIPHRIFGRSVADVVMDIQRIKTALLRALLDNAYLANNPRTEVPESIASDDTLDDLLLSRPGGIIRTKTPGGLNVIQHPDVGGHVYPLLQYMDATREWRTGVTRQGQGLDANALQNQTATAAMQLYSVAQARIKLIARVFAETGIKDMFWLLHRTIRKHGDKAQTVRLRNKWVTVDPRQWKARNDMTINVGLGTGGKQERLSGLMQLIMAQEKAVAVPGLVKPKHFHNSAKRLVELIGENDVDLYFGDPGEDAEMPPPENPEDKKAQMQMQIEQMKAQQDDKRLQVEAQIKSQELTAKAQIDQAALQSKASIEQLQAEADIATQTQKVQSEMAIAERKFELERDLKMLDHQMKMAEHNATMQMKQKEFEMGAVERAHGADLKEREFGMKAEERKAAAKAKPKATK